MLAGMVTACVVDPVKNCEYVLADVNVVVPAAVAVVVYPSSKLLTVVLALLSRETSVDAVAAEATPVPVGSPLMTGVASVGDVPKTTAPVPVPPVTAAAKLADDGVARKVAMPVPNPDTPVEIGRPVALVSVNVDGVPKFGVVSVGLVEKTRFEDVVPVVPVAALR